MDLERIVIDRLPEEDEKTFIKRIEKEFYRIKKIHSHNDSQLVKYHVPHKNIKGYNTAVINFRIKGKFSGASNIEIMV